MVGRKLSLWDIREKLGNLEQFLLVAGAWQLGGDGTA